MTPGASGPSWGTALDVELKRLGVALLREAKAGHCGRWAFDPIQHLQAGEKILVGSDLIETGRRPCDRLEAKGVMLTKGSLDEKK